MSRRHSGSNAFLAALLSMVPGRRTRKTGPSRQRSGLWVSEALESRQLLSSTSLGQTYTDYQAFSPQTTVDTHQGFLTGPDAGAPLDIAMAYLRGHAAEMGLTSPDIDSLRITNNYQSAGSQVTHLYFQQTVNGLPVVNSHLNINIARNGEVINVGSSILPGVASSTPAPSPQLTAVQALNSLVSSLHWTYEGTPQVLSVKTLEPTQDTVITSAGISMAAEIPASLRYVPRTDGSLQLVWLLNVQTTDSNSWYDVSISAASGQVVNLVDWTNQASYHAEEIPFENPLERPTALIVDPQLRALTASPFGWHDTDGVAGAEFTDTRGNAVNAQEDKNADNAGGNRPSGGAGLVFNFPFDPARSAQLNEDAAIVNLFYWNNVIHDVLHGYGFDEVSGNFQNNNYGRGGLGADQVEADALDGSGQNNANFSTPPDGISGRMQMFEFTLTTPTRDSDMDSFIMVHEFGHGLTNRLTGGPANSAALQLAQSRGMGEGWSDFLGLMMVQKPSDTQAMAYSTGNYVLGNPLNDPFGGIRDFPYAVDMSISPKTYGWFNAFTAPHPNGEIICATLWDLNWLMINGNGGSVTGKGYEPDIYNNTSGAGNIELMKVFVEALKLQPANPTYLDFRDAMLNADLAITGGDNEIAIWTAFARRGMGFSAQDGGSAASNNVVEAFDLPPGLLFELFVTPNPVFENAGFVTTGVVNVGGAIAELRRPANTPVNTLLVATLTSSDTSEIRVPVSVMIQPGSTSVFFPIDIIDDTLLDGTQTVQLRAQATIGGKVKTARATVNVLDFESMTVQIDKSSIYESDGPAAALLTITRSNTDSAAPNVFAVAGNKLLEFDSLGVMASTRNIPWPAGPRPVGEDAHDLIMLQNGRIAVYNGTTIGYVSIFNPATTTWQHFLIPGLSTDAADITTGGITSWGTYVFVSDMQSATPGNPFGAVRLDLSTGAIVRFATTSLDYRMFVKDLFGNNILEIDPVTGTTRNVLPMPISLAANNGFNNGLAFDGKYLWVLAGGIGNDQVYQINADTGAVLEIHHLGGASEWDGLAWLNGRLYALDNGPQNVIHVYDPAVRQVVKTLNVGALNQGIDIGGGLAGITGPDALFATRADRNEVFEIDPATGLVTNLWSTGMMIGAQNALGLATANNEVFVGAVNAGELSVFSRDGFLLRTMDVTLAPTEGVFALGGDNLKGLVTTSYRYRDLFAGLDDQLYVLDNGGFSVGRYNPTTLTLDRFFDVSNQINALAVAANGTIWGAGKNGTLYHFDNSGALLPGGALVTGAAELIDIEINVTGQILLTDVTGTVLQTNTSLAMPTMFSTGTVPAFITLGQHQLLPAGDLVVTLTNSDISELSIPLQVILPVGQQSVTVPIDALDDRILDGTQTVTITSAAIGYVDATGSVDVLDDEWVYVDILATEISEAAPNNTTTVRVSRTNLDGPFPYTSKQSFSNNTSLTILDYTKVRSYITVPDQASRVSDIDVTLSLTHSYLADLDIYLVSPTGIRVELVTDLNNSQKFMTNTTFDDQALGGILEGTAPFTGHFRPEGSLAAMNGINPTGIWTLEITDDNQRDFGTLYSWSMGITTAGLAALTVQIAKYGATDKINVQTSVVIPANTAEIVIPLNGVDDTLLGGTQFAIVAADSINATGFNLGWDYVFVTDLETLTFTVDRTTISEDPNIAPGYITGTLTRFNTDLNELKVNVFSSDLSELMPEMQEVTIPAGETSVTFKIFAVDDVLIDGNQLVTITVVAPDYGADLTQDITVEDLEPSLNLTTVTPVVREDGGSLEVTVTRLDQSDISQPMTVSLVSSNVPGGGNLRLTVPSSVVIPGNATQFTFTVTINDDWLLDGTQIGRIDATFPGLIPGWIQVSVTDVETLSVTFNKTEFLENAGPNAAKGTVTRSNTNIGAPLTVTLTSNDLSELTVPATVIIPGGFASVDFDIAAVNDPILDGPQTVVVSAAAAGYYPGSGSIVVLDHEPPVITAPGAVTDNPRPTIVWGAIPGAIRYELQLANVSSGVSKLILTSVTGTQFTPPEKLGVARYRVWVRAIDSLERPGFWSNPKDFKIDTAPTLTAPVITGQTVATSFPEISWTAVTDAARYELWVNSVVTPAVRVITRADLITTSYRATESLGSGSYTAWVRAFNGTNEFGKWSQPLTFTVLAAPAIITPTTGGSFDRTPTFSWTAIPTATSYDIWVSNKATNVVMLRDQFVTGTTVTAATDFPIGEYNVWVRAQKGTQFSVWSAPRLFSIGTSPTITSPTANATTGNKPNYVWTSVSGAARFELWVMNVNTTARVLYLTDLKTANYQSTTALPAGTYRVWVRAVSTMGETTAWSKDVTFKVASVSSPLPAAPDVARTLLTSALNNRLAKSLRTQITAKTSLQTKAARVESESDVAAGLSPAPLNPPSADLPRMKFVPVGSDSVTHDEVMAAWDVSNWWMAAEASAGTLQDEQI